MQNALVDDSFWVEKIRLLPFVDCLMLSLKKLWVGIAFFLSMMPSLEAGYGRERSLLQFFDWVVSVPGFSEGDRTTTMAAQSYLHVCDFWLHIEAILIDARDAGCLEEVIAAAQGRGSSENYLMIRVGQLCRWPKYVYCQFAGKWQKRAQSIILAGYDVPVNLEQVLASEDPVAVVKAIVEYLDPECGYHLLKGLQLSLMERYPRIFLQHMGRELNGSLPQPSRGRDMNLRGAAATVWGSDIPLARL